MKVAVFIDNSNVFHDIKQIKESDPEWVCLYDPLKLSQKLTGSRELAQVSFYCVRPPAYLLKDNKKSRERYKTTNRYYAAIEKLPLVKVKYGDLKGSKGSLQEKNVDTQLAIDMTKGAAFGQYDTAILISGDGDCKSAVDAVKEFNKKIELVFFRGSISMNLKQSCDVIRRARRSYFQPLDFDKTAEDEVNE